MCAVSFKNQIFVPNMLIKPLNLAVSIDYVNSICMFCFTFSVFSFFSVGCLMLYRGNALIYYEGLEKNTACYFKMILKVKVTNI